jgi:hypothetical protein
MISEKKYQEALETIKNYEKQMKDYKISCLSEYLEHFKSHSSKFMEMINAFNSGDSKLESIEDCNEKDVLLYLIEDKISKLSKLSKLRLFDSDDISEFENKLKNSSKEERKKIILDIIDTEFVNNEEIKNLLKNYKDILKEIKLDIKQSFLKK